MEKQKIGIRVKLNGSIAWEVIRRDGSRRMASPTRQNMIVTSGYELLAEAGIAWYGDLESAWPKAYAMVGSGTSDPSVDDTTIDGLVAYTNSNGGVTTQINRVSDGVYDITYTRQFTSDQVGGQNLTRWAMTPLLTGSPYQIFAQDLFRDADGNPVTLTLAADEQLRLTWTLRVTMTPVTPTAFSINGIDGQFTLLGDDPGYHYRGFGDLGVVSALMRGTLRRYETEATSSDYAIAYDQQPGSGTDASEIIAGAYTSGTRQRNTIAKWATTAANGNIYGVTMAQQYYSKGLYIRFDNPISKTDTQEFVAEVRVSW